MALLSRSTATGIAATQVYSFSFTALAEDEVYMSVDGVEYGPDVLTTDLDAGTATLSTGLGGYTFVGSEEIVIFRDTPQAKAERYVQPADEGPLSMTALAKLQLQLLQSVQELNDALGGDPPRGAAGRLVTWNADGDPPSVLEPGTAGQVLSSQGAALPLTWVDPTLGNSTSTTIQSAIDYREVRAFNVGSPAAGESEPAFYTDRALEVTALHGVLIGSSTPSVDINVRHSTDRSAAGNTVLTADATITSTTTATTVNSGFDDETIPAGSWVWLDITAVSGTVDFLSLELRASIPLA